MAITRSACSLLLLAALAGCGPAIIGRHDDPSISTRVKIALLNDSQVGPLRIDARTSQRVVTLSGSVRSQSDVERALAVARRVAGVTQAKSDLKVGGS